MFKTCLKFWSYLKKDLLLFVKRKKYLYLTLLIPLVVALIFILMISPNNYSIKMGVCDFDNTQQSKQAINELQNFNAVFLENNGNCTDKLIQEVRSGTYAAGLEIGKGFSENINNLKQAKLVIYYDETDVAFSNLISWKVDASTKPFERKIIDNLNTELKNKVSSTRSNVEVAKELSSGTIKNKVEEIDSNLQDIEQIETEFLVNPIWTEMRPVSSGKSAKENSIAFILPIILLFTLLMLSSTLFIYDKKNKFLTRVKTSTSISLYIFSKLVFFFILAIVQFLTVLLLYFAFGANYTINFLNILHLILAISLINTLIGLIIGLVSENEGIAILFSLVVSFPLMLLSGIFYPIQTMSGFMQKIVTSLPLHYEIGISKKVLLFNQGFSGNWFWFALILFIGVCYFVRKKGD